MRSSIAGCLGWIALLGCGGEPERPHEQERVGQATFALSVDEAVSSGCSTKQVEGLSLQIIAQGNCIEPGAFEKLLAPSNVNMGSAVLPYLEEPARNALLGALNQNPSTQMQINSMLRTVAQQYLLYRWYQLGACGVGLAATPGSSNHETGLAVDVQQYGTWKPILEAHGFKWLGEHDPVHFDYVGPGAIDYRGLDVLAFQELWNRNNPSDLIVEDGIYGSQTESRLKQSPAEGFPQGADCGPEPQPEPGAVSMAIAFEEAADVFADGPSAGVVDVFVGEPFGLSITLTNDTAEDVDSWLVEVSLDEAFAVLGYSVDRAASKTPPGLDFSVDGGIVAAGDTKTILLDLAGALYTADRKTPPTIAVKSPGIGQKNVPADVYSQRKFTWDGGRLEGWSSTAAIDLVVEDGALRMESSDSDVFADSPSLEVPPEEVVAITLSASRDASSDAPAVLFVAFDGASFVDATRHELPLPNDGARHEIRIEGAELRGFGEKITRLRFSGFDGEPGALALHGLSLDGAAPSPDPLAGSGPEGCACRTASEPSSPWSALVLAGLGALVLLRRRSLPSRG